jgi:tetratricopeptide (TPR) repeat protein
MDDSSAQKAIDLALAGNWKEAVAANLGILSQNSEDVEAMNRLARAYGELGKISEAREVTKKVLKIDPFNTIALKCLEKLKTSKNLKTQPSNCTAPDSFLEEPGKTKLVTLLNLGDGKVISNLSPGEKVTLSPHSHKVSVNTPDGKYIGRLPDDLALRLRNLIKAGNKYQVLIKSVDPKEKEVNVFMREVERGAKVLNIPSFPTEKIDYVSFTPPELVHKDVPQIETGEES